MLPFAFPASLVEQRRFKQNPPSPHFWVTSQSSFVQHLPYPTHKKRKFVYFSLANTSKWYYFATNLLVEAYPFYHMRVWTTPNDSSNHSHILTWCIELSPFWCKWIDPVHESPHHNLHLLVPHAEILQGIVFFHEIPCGRHIYSSNGFCKQSDFLGICNSYISKQDMCYFAAVHEINCYVKYNYCD